MSQNQDKDTKVDRNSDIIESGLGVLEEPLSIEKKYEYLEQIRDYIYKDVVLADAKARFALTIVTVALAAAFTQFKSPNIYWYIGLVFAGLSILCSMLTILPRSYVTHKMIKDPNHWVNLKNGWWNEVYRRFHDALNVLIENFWQKQSKGTTNSLKLLLESGSDETLVDSLSEGMQRAFLAMNLKYLWVGKALLFAFLTFCFMGMSLLLSIDSSTKDGLDPKSINKEKKIIEILNEREILVDSIISEKNVDSLEQGN